MNLRNHLLIPAAGLAALALTACERPPVDSEQIGYRGTAMVQVNNPRRAVEVEAPAPLPAVPQVGPKAGDIYQSVQVLGDLPVTEFNRTMQSITEWVAPPEEGCNYCHNPENLASDDKYTKRVARRMLQMNRYVNAEYEAHMGETGVTCYTCHLGKPVPARIWFADNSEAGAAPYAGNRNGQNIAAPQVGLSSLPLDPFSKLLTDVDVQARVLSPDWPPKSGDASIQATEYTYALMMHMSGALGVNCTYCHNSNNFGGWANSTPARVKAWHAVNMTQDVNQNYLIPLKPEYPAERLGPTGDAPKANCATCHGGLPLPLNGAPMAAEYPAFWSR